MSNNEDYSKAVHLVLTERRAGAAFIKSKLLLSDSKVARILKEMEKTGVVSKMTSGGARNVLLPPPPKPEPAEVEQQASPGWSLSDVVQASPEYDDED